MNPWPVATLLLVPALCAGRMAEVPPGGDLRRAVALASAGDTVAVAGGRHRVQALVVNKPLVLLGRNRAVLDGEGRGYVLVLTAPGCVVRGFAIVNSGRSNLEEYAGLKVENTYGCIIEDNDFENNYFGIYLAGARACVVRNNRIVGLALSESSSGNGVHLWKCSHIAITGNTIRKHRDGIYIEFSKHTYAAGNRCTGNLRYGLHFMFSDSSSYRMNIFSGNGTGVAVMYTRNVVMDRNAFLNNRGSNAYGLLFKDISHSALTGNVFAHNTSGLYMEGSNNLVIEHNRLHSKGSGIRLLGNCFNDTIRLNNFRGNTFDVTTNAQANLNRIEGNYWDRYAGYDLDGDGHGDVAHCPVSLYSKITEEYPAALLLLHSFFTNVLDRIESLLPTLVPAQFSDARPAMHPFDL